MEKTLDVYLRKDLVGHLAQDDYYIVNKYK